MTFKQFLSAAASAAILLTSVTVSNVNAVTVVPVTPGQQTQTTTVVPQTTTAPIPATTVIGTDNAAPPMEYLTPEKSEIDIELYENAELYFTSRYEFGMKQISAHHSEAPEQTVCDTAAVKYKEESTGRTMYKLVIHGNKVGSEPLYISDYDGRYCTVKVNVKRTGNFEANNALKAMDNDYGKNGIFSPEEDSHNQIYFQNAKGFVFADLLINKDNAVKDAWGSYGSGGTGEPFVNIDTDKEGKAYVLATDTEGKSCMLTVNVKKREARTAVTTAPIYPENPLSTTTVSMAPVNTSITYGTNDCEPWRHTSETEAVTRILTVTSVVTAADAPTTMIVPITRIITEYVPKTTSTINILTTPIGGYPPIATTSPTTTRPGNGTGGWNPPPYMTTTTPYNGTGMIDFPCMTTFASDYFPSIDNNRLKPGSYEVTVDRYGTADLLFEKVENVVSNNLYPTDFSYNRYFDCACVYSNSDKPNTSMYKLSFYGKYPGTSQVFVQDKVGNSCIINVTVKEKEAPVINNKLKFLDPKYSDEYTVDISGGEAVIGLSGDEYISGGVLFDDYPEYIYAQVIEGNNELKFSNYAHASEDGVRSFISIGTSEPGTYKVLFTDNKGNNAVATVNAHRVPVKETTEPVITGITDEPDPDTTTTYVTTTIGYCETDVTETTPAPAEEPTEDFGEPTFLGDADLSGDFGLSDVTTLAKYLLGSSSYPLSKGSKANSDMDRNKWVNVMDLSIMIEINLRPEKMDAILAQYPVVVDKQPVNTEVVIVEPIVTTTAVNYIV